MAELDKVRKNITNLSLFIENGLYLIRNVASLEQYAPNFLLVLEHAIEEFETLCDLYEELNDGAEHPLWSKNGELFSQEWFELKEAFLPEEE